MGDTESGKHDSAPVSEVLCIFGCMVWCVSGRVITERRRKFVNGSRFEEKSTASLRTAIFFETKAVSVIAQRNQFQSGGIVEMRMRL